MTSTTPPPAPVDATSADASFAGDGRPARRFGTARALALGLAAFLGGYLALNALNEWIAIVRDDLWSMYEPFGGQGDVGRFRLLSLGAASLGAVAGVLAVIGLAARRLALGVLVVTLLSVLCHVGFAVQILATTYRSFFVDPGSQWTAADGLPYSIAVVALQVIIVLLCLVRGPRPTPVVATAPPAAGPDDTPPPVNTGHDDLATAPVPVAAGSRHHPAEEGDEPVEPDEPVDDDVFLVIHGQEYGPYPTTRVRGFMVEGRIHPGTLVRIGDETKPASEVPAIYGD